MNIKGGKNVKVSCRSSHYLYVAGQFHNDQTEKLYSFGLAAKESVYLSALPEGHYTIRLNPQWQATSTSFGINVEQGVPRISHLVLLLVALAIVPVCIGIHHFSFEARRWSESDYSPYSVE